MFPGEACRLSTTFSGAQKMAEHLDNRIGNGLMECIHLQEATDSEPKSLKDKTHTAKCTNTTYARTW